MLAHQKHFRIDGVVASGNPDIKGRSSRGPTSLGPGCEDGGKGKKYEAGRGVAFLDSMRRMRSRLTGQGKGTLAAWDQKVPLYLPH